MNLFNELLISVFANFVIVSCHKYNSFLEQHPTPALQHLEICILSVSNNKKNIYQTYQILVTFSRFLCPLRVEFRVFNDGALSSFVPGLYHGTKLQQFHLMPLETF